MVDHNLYMSFIQHQITQLRNISNIWSQRNTIYRYNETMQTIFKITEQLKVRKFLFGKIFKLFDLTNSTFQLKLLVTTAYGMQHTLFGIQYAAYLV